MRAAEKLRLMLYSSGRSLRLLPRAVSGPNLQLSFFLSPFMSWLATPLACSSALLACSGRETDLAAVA